MSQRPAFLYAVTRDVPPLEEAFAACTAVFRDHDAPTNLCSQCYSEDLETRLITAAKDLFAGKVPKPQDFAQIYFEHPACSGGEETIKLFTPYGIRDLLTGCPPEPCVVETLVQSGFWFWPERLKSPLRTLALRLFWDWFERGEYVWPTPDYHDDGLLGPGDDILNLCTLCQIDPYALVQTLSTLHTPFADSAVCGPLNFSAATCTYVAADTSKETEHYQTASEMIAGDLSRREDTGFVDFITPDWTDDAFFRNAERAPQLAKELSEFRNAYDIRMARTVQGAQRPQYKAGLICRRFRRCRERDADARPVAQEPFAPDPPR